MGDTWGPSTSQWRNRLGGGTLWYHGIYNRDSEQGDNEYINYRRNKNKREKEKNQPINTILFSKMYLERFLLQDIPQTQKKKKKQKEKKKEKKKKQKEKKEKK